MTDNSDFDSLIGNWVIWCEYTIENKDKFIIDMIGIGGITKSMHKRLHDNSIVEDKFLSDVGYIRDMLSLSNIKIVSTMGFSLSLLEYHIELTKKEIGINNE